MNAEPGFQSQKVSYEPFTMGIVARIFRYKFCATAAAGSEGQCSATALDCKLTSRSDHRSRDRYGLRQWSHHNRNLRSRYNRRKRVSTGPSARWGNQPHDLDFARPLEDDGADAARDQARFKNRRGHRNKSSKRYGSLF